MAGGSRRWERDRAAAEPHHDDRNPMPTCAICSRSIDGPVLTDGESGSVFHPACAADRVPGDLVVAVVALAAAVLAPVAVLWAS
jgi:hypothetical protein